MKAALYCRVSTEEQAKTGFSLRQQLATLRRYCDAHALEVVGEFEDRASVASLDQLGFDALRDAVSAGGVDVVLAQDPPSRNSNRTWELSGGIGVCGHCGSRLKTHTTSNAAKTTYFYYVCPK
jgi:DNA invertase Pin-like site-specific DNA recombinase